MKDRENLRNLKNQFKNSNINQWEKTGIVESEFHKFLEIKHFKIGQVIYKGMRIRIIRILFLFLLFNYN